MSQMSRIELLPREQREELERLWLNGGYTRKQLHAHLKSLGFDISYGNLTRHVQKLQRRMERYRDAQEVSGRWIKQVGQPPDTNIGRLLLEMLRVVAFRQLCDLGDDKAEPATTPREIAVLAKALNEMEAASSAIDDRETRLTEKLKSELEQKAEAMKQQHAGPRDEVAAFEKAKVLVRGLL
jgi:uncharacterized protein DUF3486